MLRDRAFVFAVLDPLVLAIARMDALVLLEPEMVELSPSLSMRLFKEVLWALQNIRLSFCILLLQFRLIFEGRTARPNICNSFYFKLAALSISQTNSFFDFVCNRLLRDQILTVLLTLRTGCLITSVHQSLAVLTSQVLVKPFNFTISQPLLAPFLIGAHQFDQILLLHNFSLEIAKPEYFRAISVNACLQLLVSLIHYRE